MPSPAGKGSLIAARLAGNKRQFDPIVQQKEDFTPASKARELDLYNTYFIDFVREILYMYFDCGRFIYSKTSKSSFKPR